MFQIQTLLADKAELENHLKILSDKLSSALSECNAKDDLAKKQAKLAMEAMAGKLPNIITSQYFSGKVLMPHLSIHIVKGLLNLVCSMIIDC